MKGRFFLPYRLVGIVPIACELLGLQAGGRHAFEAASTARVGDHAQAYVVAPGRLCGAALLEKCPTEGPKIGQELAKHVLPVCVSMVGPEGFEPPTKRL